MQYDMAGDQSSTYRLELEYLKELQDIKNRNDKQNKSVRH